MNEGSLLCFRLINGLYLLLNASRHPYFRLINGLNSATCVSDRLIKGSALPTHTTATTKGTRGQRACMQKFTWETDWGQHGVGRLGCVKLPERVHQLAREVTLLTGIKVVHARHTSVRRFLFFFCFQVCHFQHCTDGGRMSAKEGTSTTWMRGDMFNVCMMGWLQTDMKVWSLTCT